MFGQGIPFGSQPTAAPTPGGMFGAQQTPAAAAPQSIFGGQTSQPTSLFGAQRPPTQAPATTGMFGAQQTQTPAPAPSMFAQNTQSQGFFGQATTQTSLLGQQSQQYTNPSAQQQAQASNTQNQFQTQDLQTRLNQAPVVRTALTKLTNPDEGAAYRLLDIYERIEQLRAGTPDLVRFKWCIALVPEEATAMEAELANVQKDPNLLQWTKQWVEANPNPMPGTYHLKVLNGFADLILHGDQKKRQFEILAQGLENVHVRQRKIREELDYEIKQRLTVVRKKHWGLKAKFVRCMGLLEDFAHQNQTAAVHVDLVRQLDAGMHNFQTELTGSGIRTYADTIRQRMWHVAQRAVPRSVKGQAEDETLLGIMSDRDVEAVVELTDRQNDGLDTLRLQLESDSRCIAVMQKSLQHKPPSNHRPRGYRR
eukprot:Selendium_serpulae@DN6192_c0_g1_i4.p1